MSEDVAMYGEVVKILDPILLGSGLRGQGGWSKECAEQIMDEV
jgi:hypothetical protein